MNNSVSNIWERALAVFKEEFSTITYDTWFANVIPVKLIEDKLYLLTDNFFIRDTLNAQYKAVIVDPTLSSITGRETSAVFVLDENEIPPEKEEAVTGEAPPDDTERNIQAANLMGKYTFEKFVVGENNRFANAACVAVAEAPSERYNPLFIYGNVGLGKTHLMQAIGHQVLDTMPTKKVVYVSCETFTNEFINAVKSGNNDSFRAKYRSVDVLLIDDIQFLTGKEGTQEEFFHTFNDLQGAEKQIVISSDRPPKEIAQLEDRLRSRFEMGLITDIDTPNFETRMAILRKKAEAYTETIPGDVLSYIADSIHSNIRELEGALTTVAAYANLQSKPIDLPLAKEALKSFLQKQEDIIVNADYIKDITAKYFNITVDDMNSKKRTKNIAQPRQVAMYLTRELTDLSLPKIGEEFGGRDHSTVIHGCNKINEEMGKNADFKNLITRIRKEVER